MPDLDWFMHLGHITDPHWWFYIGLLRLIRYGNQVAGVT